MSDKDSTMKDAIAEMRQEMRGRVGKKLLSIEVMSHGEEPDDEEVKGDDTEDEEQRKIGMPIL